MVVVGEPGDEGVRVVVAEHRQRGDHDAVIRPFRDSGSVTCRNVPHRPDAEVARRLELPLVDAVERRVERDDQERHVAVGER